MEKIRLILSEIRPDVDFRKSKNFVLEGLLDSIDIIELISRLEAAFSISIPSTFICPDAFANIETIEQLIQKCLGTQSEATKSNRGNNE